MSKIIALSKQEVNCIFGASSDEFFNKKTNTTSHDEPTDIPSVIIRAFAAFGAVGATYYVAKCIFNGIDRKERYFYNRAHFIKPPKSLYKKDKRMA